LDQRMEDIANADWGERSVVSDDFEGKWDLSEARADVEGTQRPKLVARSISQDEESS